MHYGTILKANIIQALALVKTRELVRALTGTDTTLNQVNMVSVPLKCKISR